MRTNRFATLADVAATAGRCGGCGRVAGDLPSQAVYCPDCGHRLKPQFTVWGAVSLFVDHLRHPPIAQAGDPGPRAPVVIGYGNALWRLGWRYEHGRGGAMRNVPEAMRCYRKSAGLGNVEAASRLELQSIVALPVLTTEPEQSADQGGLD